MLDRAEVVATAAAAAAAAVATATATPPEESLMEHGVRRPQTRRLVEQFLKLKPPRFSGTGDPETAASWIEELEKIFALLECSEAEKVTLAVYQLQDNASSWWKATRRRVFPEDMVPTWDVFVETFNGKYFSDCARDLKVDEFLHLRQNQWSVDQYEARFTELSKYAPRMVENSVDRAKRFRDGLKPEIKSMLAPLNLKDYDELYERAQCVEKDMSERTAASGSRFTPAAKDNRRFGKGPVTGNKFSIPPNRRNAIGKLPYRPNGMCQFCKQKHGAGLCPRRMGACYGCGQHGHQVRECPQR